MRWVHHLIRHALGFLSHTISFCDVYSRSLEKWLHWQHSAMMMFCGGDNSFWTRERQYIDSRHIMSARIVLKCFTGFILCKVSVYVYLQAAVVERERECGMIHKRFLGRFLPFFFVPRLFLNSSSKIFLFSLSFSSCMQFKLLSLSWTLDEYKK